MGFNLGRTPGGGERAETPMARRDLICRKCRTRNIETANYCSHCGTALKSGLPKARGMKQVGPLVVLIILSAISSVLMMRGLWSTKGEMAPPRSPDKTPPSHEVTEPREIGVSLPQGKSPVFPKGIPSAGLKEIPVGWVSIRNPWGKEVSRIRAAVVGGSWIALPTRFCLGGDQWCFRPGEVDETRIEGGIWRDLGGVSLWRLEEGWEFEGPELYPWEEGLPLEWLPLEGDRDENRIPVKVISFREEGLFLKVSLSQKIEKTGLLIQKDRVVGWTFGDPVDIKYLWKGKEGSYLGYDIRVDHFYNMTFAHGREEQLSKALAMGEETPLAERLAAFAEGFRKRPELPEEYTPPDLLSVSAVQEMRSIIEGMVEKGQWKGVADILDRHVLLEASHPYLLMDAVSARANGYGYENAIDLLEGVGEYVVRAMGKDVPQLQDLHLTLYIHWIRELLGKRDLRDSRDSLARARRYFPEDLELRLLGVEQHLMEGDWEGAERFLNATSYPQHLIDRSNMLRAAVSRMKGEAGKIVIRFYPGSKEIPVRAMLNGTVTQDFLIDTGASMVSIPTSTIQALGVRIDERVPRKQVTTAGGVRVVPEILLASIELENWMVHDIRAWVLDIPNRPGLGLLGLNFLRHFNMEFDDQAGVLLLRPK